MIQIGQVGAEGRTFKQRKNEKYPRAFNERYHEDHVHLVRPLNNDSIQVSQIESFWINLFKIMAGMIGFTCYNILLYSEHFFFNNGDGGPTIVIARRGHADWFQRAHFKGSAPPSPFALPDGPALRRFCRIQQIPEDSFLDNPQLFSDHFPNNVSTRYEPTDMRNMNLAELWDAHQNHLQNTNLKGKDIFYNIGEAFSIYGPTMNTKLTTTIEGQYYYIGYLEGVVGRAYVLPKGPIEDECYAIHVYGMDPGSTRWIDKYCQEIEDFHELTVSQVPYIVGLITAYPDLPFQDICDIYNESELSLLIRKEAYKMGQLFNITGSKIDRNLIVEKTQHCKDFEEYWMNEYQQDLPIYNLFHRYDDSYAKKILSTAKTLEPKFGSKSLEEIAKILGRAGTFHTLYSNVYSAAHSS